MYQLQDGTTTGLPVSQVGNSYVFSYPCPSATSCQNYIMNLNPGQYIIEVWGAQGANGKGTGGKGGYSRGNLTILNSMAIYIFIGGNGINGQSSNGGWNGGGAGWGYSGTYFGAGGGGATDIRIGGTSLTSRVLVAGGGGGGGGIRYGLATGGAGGGNTGGTGQYYPGYGGTQSAGGGSTSNGGLGGTGQLGIGGDSTIYTDGNDLWAGGGGGGYYGGGGSGTGGSGGGGSGFITTQSLSSHIFTGIDNQAGTSTFPSPLSGSETGHTGHGGAKVTFLTMETPFPTPSSSPLPTSTPLPNLCTNVCDVYINAVGHLIRLFYILAGYSMISEI